MKITQHRLKPEVEEWVNKGILQRDQATAILNLYPLTGTNYWIIAFAVIGSLLILGGISLIIASNWQDIPNTVKIGGLLLLHLAVTTLGIESQRLARPRPWWECSYLASSILPLLGLMLISQIFHIQGKASNLFMVWTAAIALLPFLTRSGTAFIVFLTALMITLGTKLEDVWQGTRYDDFEYFCAAYMIFGVVCALASQGWKVIGEKTLHTIGEYWGVFTLFIATYALGCAVTDWFVVWGLLFLGCLGLIYHGYATERIHQVNLGFVVTGLVIVSVFLRLVGSMFDTGLIFLVGGIGLIAFVIILNKMRRNLVEKLK